MESFKYKDSSVVIGSIITEHETTKSRSDYSFPEVVEVSDHIDHANYEPVYAKSLLKT